MIDIKYIDDLRLCRQIWQSVWPVENIFDNWEVRYCFERSYNRPPCFIVAEDGGTTLGLLALSWVEEDGRFCHFPGEIWSGKTWLEQNRIIFKNRDIALSLLEKIEGDFHIRYLTPDSVFSNGCDFEADEKAYMFYPGHYNYSFNEYLNQFSGKSRKKIFSELSKLEAKKITYHYNRLEDIDHLFRMNLSNFGLNSYFHDNRFLRAFEYLIEWLSKEGYLRITTVLIGGEMAAVDLGAVFEKNYTLLAGGTNPEFKGVAKLINFHHMEYACDEHLKQVEFLCGDFGWKERFHLVPSQLYQYSKNNPKKNDSIGK